MCPLASDALTPCHPRLAFVQCLATEARHHRCLRMPKRARSSIRRSPSPSQLPRRWARLRMPRMMSEVNLRCRTLHSGRCAAIRLAIRCFADLCRSPPQRAAQPLCTSSKGDEAHSNFPRSNFPRMPGSMPWNRSLLIAISMLNRPAPQVLSRIDRVAALRFRWVPRRLKPQA